MDTKVKITVFKWAGSWGPFKITIPCGECSLTRDVIQDTIQNELAGIPIDLDIRDWLSEWWKPLIKGGWHAPIVMVDGAVISQGVALNRGVLTQAVIESYSKSSKIHKRDNRSLFQSLRSLHCSLYEFRTQRHTHACNHHPNINHGYNWENENSKKVQDTDLAMIDELQLRFARLQAFGTIKDCVLLTVNALIASHNIRQGIQPTHNQNKQKH